MEYEPDNRGMWVAFTNAVKNKDLEMMELAASEFTSESDKAAAVWHACLKTGRFKYQMVMQLLEIVGYHHINSLNQNGTAIVEIAARTFRNDMLVRLLSLGADLNILLETGLGFVHMATASECVKGNAKAKNYLRFDNIFGRLKERINFNLQTGPLCAEAVFKAFTKKGLCSYSMEEGETPLHQACKWGSLKVVKALCDKKVNPNLQDSEGRTPLHWLVLGADEEPFSSNSPLKEREEILRFLCGKYSQTSLLIKDRKKRTVYDLIRLRMYKGDFVPCSFYQTNILDPRKDPGRTKDSKGFTDCLLNRLFKVQKATLVARECAKVLPEAVMELIGSF